MKDMEKDLELEAFRLTSNLSTSFVKKIPEKFYDLYELSNGTAESMYSNCMHAFLVLSKLHGLLPLLNIKTSLYKLDSNYYTDLNTIEEENRNKAKIVRIKPGEAIHLFCIKATALFHTKSETNIILKNIKNGIKKKDELISSDSMELKVEDFNKALYYLLELLDSEISSNEIINKRKTKKEIDEERNNDRKQINKYLSKLRFIKIPLPETRLRNSKGVIYKGAKNKLGVSDSIQEESDKLKKKLKYIRRKEQILMGGNERFVDFERKKYLEAAIKRNNKLQLQNNQVKKEKRVRCDCTDIDNCTCNLINIYGEVLGKPVSLKLEEELFNTHGIVKDNGLKRKNELKYYKSLIKDKDGKRKKLYSPSWEIIVPLSSLSKLQLMTLEQLSGIELDIKSGNFNSLPQIKEINHERNCKITESVPINEDLEDERLRKRANLQVRKYN